LEEESMDHQAFSQLLGNYGEFVGAVAVVFTLGYLAIQVRQNSKIIQAQMYQARTQMSEDRYGQIADSQFLAEIYCKLESADRRFDPAKVGTLSAEELLRVRLSEQRMLRGLDNVFHQHTLGFLPDDFLEEAIRMIRRRYDLWQQIELYPVRQSFHEFIEDAVSGAVPDS